MKTRRQEGEKLIPFVEHQRTIHESIRVIVHVIAEEEETGRSWLVARMRPSRSCVPAYTEPQKSCPRSRRVERFAPHSLAGADVNRAAGGKVRRAEHEASAFPRQLRRD